MEKERMPILIEIWGLSDKTPEVTLLSIINICSSAVAEINELNL